MNNPHNLDLSLLPEGCTYTFLPQGNKDFGDKPTHYWESVNYRQWCSNEPVFGDIKYSIEIKHQKFIDKVTEKPKKVAWWRIR